jgi:hypothetical protein
LLISIKLGTAGASGKGFRSLHSQNACNLNA